MASISARDKALAGIEVVARHRPPRSKRRRPGRDPFACIVGVSDQVVQSRRIAAQILYRIELGLTGFIRIDQLRYATERQLESEGKDQLVPSMELQGARAVEMLPDVLEGGDVARAL